MAVFGVLTASSAAGLLGLTLLTDANQGFYAAFTAKHGADLAVTVNASKVTAADLAKTHHLPGVTQAAGPYPETTITVTASGSAKSRSSPEPAPAGKHAAGGFTPVTLTVVGRPSPSGPLDHIIANPAIMSAISDGQSRWPDHPGEISIAQATPIRLPLGSKLTVTSGPGKPQLTIVGYGSEVVLYYDGGWVTPVRSRCCRPRAPRRRTRCSDQAVPSSSWMAQHLARSASLPSARLPCSYRNGHPGPFEKNGDFYL